MRISDRYIVIVSMGLSVVVHVDTHHPVYKERYIPQALCMSSMPSLPIPSHPILHPTMMIVVHNDDTAVYVALDCSMP